MIRYLTVTAARLLDRPPNAREARWLTRNSLLSPQTTGTQLAALRITRLSSRAHRTGRAILLVYTPADECAGTVPGSKLFRGGRMLRTMARRVELRDEGGTVLRVMKWYNDMPEQEPQAA